MPPSADSHDPREAQIRSLVRQALARLIESADQPAANEHSGSQRPIVDAAHVGQAAAGQPLDVPTNALITPLARQVAMERGIVLEAGPAAVQRTASSSQRTVAIGADHGGFQLKGQLTPLLQELNWQVIDCGTHGPESVDYPDYAFAVARQVAEGRAAWGIIIDGAGLGSCMVANKVPGIRAAMCYDLVSAMNSREHNHANVLTLGAGLIGPNLARQIVKTWLETPFGPGRHARRVDKIMQIEQRFLRK